jgi:ABC-type glycerol-3-phosphate transport system substrate-binding protein
MKTTKLVSTMLSAFLVVSLAFTGCTSQSPKTTSSSKATTSQKTTLTFYGFSDWVATAPYQAAYQDAKAKFEQENPGYTIQLESDPYSNWDQKYLTMLASGSLPDVFFVNNPDFPTFANSNSLLNIGKYVSKGYFSDFFPGVLSFYSWRGQNMGIPFTTDARILWMNKNIFKAAGLDTANPPTTWDQLKTDALTITKKTGKYGFGMDMGLKQLPAESLLCASNTSTIKVAADGTVTPNVDTPDFRSYLQLLIDMKPSYEPDYTTLDNNDVGKSFSEGQFGMIIGGTLSATDIYSQNWYAQALVPKEDASAPEGTFGGGFGLCISAKTKAPAQAVAFAQLLTSADYNYKLVSDIPASNAGMAKSSLATDPKMAMFAQQIKYVRQAQPKTLYYSSIDEASYEAVESVVAGGTPINQGIANLTSKIKSIISQ